MDTTMETCREFTRLLASDRPTPGGGGGAALVGAVAAALGGMVTALTVGKPAYAAVEPELRSLCRTCETLRLTLLELVEADAEGFAPLAAAYAIPKEEPHRAEAMESATLQAVKAPMEILRACAAVIKAAERLSEIGAVSVRSDAGCAAVCARGAMEAAALNVFVNTHGLKDRAAARALEEEAEALLEDGIPRAEAVYTALIRGYKEGSL